MKLPELLPMMNDEISIANEIQKLEGVYLGGSRRMNQKFPDLIKINDNSDYDFYIQHTEENVAKLDSISPNSATIVVNNPYGDDDAVAIWVCKNCQVVLRRNAIMYNAMFESLTGDFFKDYLWKSGINKPSRDQIKAIINQLLSSMTLSSVQ